MTHDKLLARIKEYQDGTVALSPYQAANKRDNVYEDPSWYALRAVVELHKPISDNSCSDPDCCGGPYPDLCEICSEHYPCETIQAIEKELR